MKKTLLSTALIIGSFAAISLGANKPITGAISAGWEDYYNYHNLVPTSNVVGAGATTIGVDLQYEIPSVVNLVANFAQTQLSNSTESVGGMDLSDQSTLFVGAEGQKWAGLTTSFGYQLTHGGLPGFFANTNKAVKKAKSGESYYSNSGLDHQLRFDALYEVKGTGLFFTGGVAYSLHGTQGWQMNVGAGYKWNVMEQLDLILSGDVTFSQNYMRVYNGNGGTMKYNGTNGYSIALSAPIQASESVVITPYASVVFAGHNAKGLSQDIAGDNGYYFKDYALVAGISATWSF